MLLNTSFKNILDIYIYDLSFDLSRSKLRSSLGLLAENKGYALDCDVRQSGQIVRELEIKL